MSARNTSTDRLVRRMAILAYLGEHGSATFAELARHFGVSLRAVVTDVLALWTTNGRPSDDTTDFVDFTVDLEEELDPEGPLDADVVGPARVTLVEGQNLDRPVPLSTREALALILGLRQLDELLAPLPAEYAPLRDAVAGARGKLAAFAGRFAAHEAGDASDPADASPQGDPRVLEALDEAADAGRQVELRYVSALDEETVRSVDPATMSWDAGHWTLAAWCHRAGAPRSFRTDRIREARVLDDAVHPEHVAAVVPGPLGVPDAGTATLDVSSRALWRVEEVPHESIAQLRDGLVRVELPVVDRAWFAGFLLRLGGAVAAVEPRDAAREAAERARAALAAYDLLEADGPTPGADGA